MQLIAETKEENELLSGLVKLLRELGVCAYGNRREDAVAYTFWSHKDCSIFFGTLLEAMSDLEREMFLLSIENPLRFAMITAGFETILNAAEFASENHSERNEL